MYSIEDFSSNERIMYHSLNSPSFMVAKRDFVYLNAKCTIPVQQLPHDQQQQYVQFLQQNPSNKQLVVVHVLTSASLEHDKAPPSAEFQRGSLIISGFVIEPVFKGKSLSKSSSSSPAPSCRVKYVVQADPAGYVPAFLVNFTNSSIVDRMKVMKQFILEEANKK